MQRHISLLGLLYIVGGGLSVLAASSLLILGLGAFTMAWTAGGDNTRLAALVTGTAFAAIAVALGLWGGANAWAGRALRRGAARARLVCLGLAVLNMFLLPFGTALGAYALWVLLHHESKRILARA